STGVSVISNDIKNTVTAFISSATVTASNGDITVEATATQSPTTTAVAIALSAALVGLAIAGADGSATLESTTQAYVSGSSLTAAGHKGYVHRSSNLTGTGTSGRTAGPPGLAAPP